MTGGIFWWKTSPDRSCTDQQGEPYQGFGLYVGRLSVPATVSNRIRYTWYQTMDFVQLVWFSLGQLVTGGAGHQ